MYSRTELRLMAKEQGVKGSHRMNMKSLCEALRIPLQSNTTFDTCNKDKITTPVKIIFKSIDGEKEFHSIYNAAANIGKNPSCIPFYIRRGSIITYKGKKWSVERSS